MPFILRYLNIFADDKDILDKILPDLQGDEPSPFVKYEKFEEVALKLLDSYDYEPDPEEVLLSAFRVSAGKACVHCATVLCLSACKPVTPPFRIGL